MENVLPVEEVTRSFGPLKAVRDLTLSLSRGDSMGFLGTNGAMTLTCISIN